MKRYTAQGFESRRDYLNSLADRFGVELKTVYFMASVLGADEDFDGLVIALEDEQY